MTHNEYRKILESDEEKAQRALFDEYIRYVYTIVCNRLSGIAKREDIEDCVSDAFAEIFKNYRTASDSEGNMEHNSLENDYSENVNFSMDMLAQYSHIECKTQHGEESNSYETYHDRIKSYCIYPDDKTFSQENYDPESFEYTTDVYWYTKGSYDQIYRSRTDETGYDIDFWNDRISVEGLFKNVGIKF